MPQDDELAQTASILKELPGGSELLAWFGGVPNFGDGEVVSLNLDRAGTSTLRVRATRRDANGISDQAIISFHLNDMIDVAIQGFSHQNVIGGLKLRHAQNEDVHPSLLGIGTVAPKLEIELEPCAGSFGAIRASIVNISVEAVSP